jgi:hypothetical protein
MSISPSNGEYHLDTASEVFDEAVVVKGAYEYGVA